MNPYNLSILCFSFCSLLLGLFVWLKRRDVVGNRYLNLSLCYTSWSFFISINLNNDVSPDMGLLMGRLGNGCALFIPPFWYHFIVSFIGNAKQRSFLVRLFYALAIITACFSFSPWFIPKVVPMVGFLYYSQAGPIFHLNTFLFFLVVALSFIELYLKIKRSEAFTREQFRGLFWTSLLGYIGGAPTFLPIYGVPFPQYTLFLLPIYPFALTYVMIKQKLFDVEEFAQAAHRDKLRAIGVLAASINHEVKNPLFIIKGLAEGCLERQKDGIFPSEKKALENSNDVMRRTIEQADRAMDIIKRLSLFAKVGIESEIKFEPVSFEDVLEDILSLVRSELAAHSIALTREIPKDLPEISTDRRYLEEILFNLIVNAIQALKESDGEGEILIRATAEEGSIRVTIQDNGPGIPEDKLKDVFRPFHTTKEEGTGLGLYITQQLVEKIKGRMKVQSVQGISTTFTIIFDGV